MADGNVTSSHSFEKVCTGCGIAKPLFEFNKSNGRPRGDCKLCHRAKSSRWQKANRAKALAIQKRWREANPDRAREHARRAYENRSPDARLKKSISQRSAYLRRKYGLSQEQWKEIYDAQGGVCALCRIPGRTGRFDVLSVDHCHYTGKVRGLLCAACNTAVGVLGDTAEAVERAVAYLRGGV